MVGRTRSEHDMEPPYSSLDTLKILILLGTAKLPGTECPADKKTGARFPKGNENCDVPPVPLVPQTVLADERKGTSRLWTTKVANPDASAYAPTSMNVLCIARRRDVKTHLHDRMHTDFGRNRHPRSYHVHRMDHATTMERAFEADFAYAHQFMH